MSDDSCEADDIAIDTGVVGHHHGPVHVTVSEAVDEFFEANGLARRSATVSRASPREQGLGDECVKDGGMLVITEQDLAELRARYGVSAES